MVNKVITFNGEQDLLEEIKVHLINKNPIIIATDTQWGICAIEPSIVNKLKKRTSKAVIQLVDDQYNNIFMTNSTDQLSNIALKFIKEFWPGEVTVIYNNIAYRRTNAKDLNKIIDYCKLQIYCSSANITNHKPINDSNEALLAFKSSEFDILLIITPNQKLNSNSLPSTIVDLNSFKIIREGVKTKKVKNFFSKYKITPQ